MNKRYTSDPRFLALFGAVLMLVLFLAFASNFKYNDSSVGRYLSHSWRSIKKFPNIIYTPLFLTKSDLPEYRLVIDADNLKTLDEALPINDDLISSFLSDENKNYVSGIFVSPQNNYSEKVKIRYRGLMQNNWQAEKKSLRIKFPKENLFLGAKVVNLIIPEDRGYFLETLSSYRAKKLGLFVPEISYVRVFINNRDFGVYLASEAWSSELLAKNNIIDDNNIFSNKDDLEKINDENPALFNWKSYIADNEDGPFEELNTLSELTNKATDEEFERKIGALVDLDKVYRWQILNVLAGSAHQSYFSNFVLLFKKETGKFEPTPWNVEFEPLKDKIYDDNLPLVVRRIFKNKKYSNQFISLLKEYLKDENLKDDLAYYDALAKDLKNDFYKDQAKNQNNLEFNKTVKDGRRLVIENFAKAEFLAEKDGTDKVVIWEKLQFGKPNFEGSFKYFNDVFLTIDQFLARNLQFYKRNNKTVVLGSGTHIFAKTVIIPKDLKLIIEPGTTLLFYPKVSLISYSPVLALGTASNLIIMRPAFLGENNAWGSFGIITDSGKNNLRYVWVSGGSADLVNGINYLSQVDIRNSISVIENSTFSDSRSDDGLHVILGSVELKNNLFRNNSSDSVDLDYVANSTVMGNKFLNLKLEGSNGDGLDLSGVAGVEISSNEIKNHGDKCISIGEKSLNIKVEKNTLTGCSIGIAVKDDSKVEIDGNTIVGNKIAGISLYRKKQEFIKGGMAYIKNSIFRENFKEIEKDIFSQILYE